MLRTFRLTLAYDGTNYVGWQVQPNGRSIQGELQRAVFRLIKTETHVVGSGRTDAGVHALAQVASISLETWRDSAESFQRAINTKLPPDISVYQSEEMPPSFHAIYHATGKRYRYQMQAGGIRDAFEHRYRWHFPVTLNLDAMRQAASQLIGEHDFACFQAFGSDRKTSVRTVRELTIDEEQGRAGGQMLTIEIEADGFLYNMVRNIVGSLVEVGRGKNAPDWFSELLESKDRNQAGPTAPPQGLFLVRVDYPF